jgi:hypothetical protein
LRFPRTAAGAALTGAVARTAGGRLFFAAAVEADWSRGDGGAAAKTLAGPPEFRSFFSSFSSFSSLAFSSLAEAGGWNVRDCPTA